MSNTPKVRFAGFAGDWEQRKLGDTFDFLQNNTLSRADLNTETGFAKNVHYGDVLIRFGEYLDASSSALPYIPSQQIVDKFKGSLLQDGDVVIADTAEDETVGKCTEIAGLQGFPTIAGLHTIPLRPKEEFAPGYLGYYMNSGSYHDQLLPLMQGTKVTSVSKSAILNTGISYPVESDEQDKIGGFFIHLDTLITLQQREYEKLVSLKSAFLDKMFPKNGSKVPELRFAGFTGDWEQRKLIEISDIVTGTTPPTKDKDNYGGDRLFVSPADIQGNRYVDETITTLTEKGYALGRELRAGTTLFVSIGSTIGKVGQLKESATTNQQINAVIPNVEMDDNFVFTMLENEADKIKKLAATQAVPIINKTTFGETEILFPKKEEQTRIGEYFSNLDNLITLHQRKLEKLKQLKQSMLYSMFV